MQVSAETFAGKRVWSGDAKSFLHVRDQIAETLRVAPTRVLLICPGEPPTNIWTEADFKSTCRSNTGKKNKLKLLFGLQPVFDPSNYGFSLKASKMIGVRDIVGADGFVESWRGAGVLVSIKCTTMDNFVPRLHTVLHRIEASVPFHLVLTGMKWTSRKQGNKWVLDPGDHGVLPCAVRYRYFQIDSDKKTQLTFLYRRIKNDSWITTFQWLAKYKKLVIRHASISFEIFPSDSNVACKLAAKFRQQIDNKNGI